MEFVRIAKKYITASGSSLPLQDYAIFITTLENAADMADPDAVQAATSFDAMKLGQFLADNLDYLPVVEEFLRAKKNVEAFKQVLTVYCDQYEVK